MSGGLYASDLQGLGADLHESIDIYFQIYIICKPFTNVVCLNTYVFG